MSSGVEFDEDTFGRAVQAAHKSAPVYSGGGSFGSGVNINPNDPKMVQWLMKKGIVKSPSAAQAVLLAVVVINLIIIYFVITYIL
jgi:hypothetical protein